MNRWIRALALDKLLFDDKGYFTTYLLLKKKLLNLTNLNNLIMVNLPSQLAIYGQKY